MQVVPLCSKPEVSGRGLQMRARVKQQRMDGGQLAAGRPVWRAGRVCSEGALPRHRARPLNPSPASTSLRKLKYSKTDTSDFSKGATATPLCFLPKLSMSFVLFKNHHFHIIGLTQHATLARCRSCLDGGGPSCDLSFCLTVPGVQVEPSARITFQLQVLVETRKSSVKASDVHMVVVRAQAIVC